MDSKVTVLEVQNDYSVKQYEVALKFPRVSKSRLYIVTNQNTQLRLLNKEGGSTKKSIFQHGVSTKVLTITNASKTAWEVRMLLSPSEISRLAPNFNIMGFVQSCLMVKNYQNSLSSLCGPKKNHRVNVQELCRAAAQFLSSSEDNIVNDYCKKLNEILTQTFRTSCTGHKIENMVLGALVALVATELATSVGGIRSLDYRVEKEKTQEDQKEQIKKMMNVFDVMVDLLTVTHQGKRVQIIFRNPCPDNWALGGKKPVHFEETFVFGLCHKVVSISEAESEVQFLQNLQESYDLISVFHLPAYVENLLMTSEWRNKIELFLKKQDERKEIIHELSSLALMFICSKSCPEKTFMKVFKREMLEKWSKVEAFIVSDEVVCSFGILVAILAAVTAKSIVDKPIPDSEEEIEELVDPITSSAGSSITSFDKSSSSEEVIVTKITGEYDGAKQAELESGDVGICDGKSKIDSTNDPGMTDQGSIDGSLKNDGPIAELPGVGTLDIADQETDNSNDIDKEDPEKPVDPIASSAPPSDGSSSTFFYDSPKVIATEVTDEFGEPKIDLDSSLGDWVKVELESDVMGICDTKSKIGITNDPEMTDQGSIDGSLKTGKHLAVFPLGGMLGIDDKEADKGDDANKEDPEKPAGKLVDPITSSVGSSSTFLHNSLNSFEVIVNSETDEYGGAKPDLDSSSGDWVKAELESGEESTCDAKSKIGTIHDPGMTDQRRIDGSLRSYDPLADLPSVGPLGITDKEADNGEGAIHSHGGGDGPSLDDSNDDGTDRVAQPPSVEARNNALEAQNSPFRNIIFKTGLMGVMCFLVVATLTNVLPQSARSIAVAIILGLLVVKWLASRHP